MKYLGFLGFILLFLISCGESAITYNDTLVQPQIEISENLNVIFSPNVDYDDIQKHRELMVERAEKGLEVSRKLNDFKGNSTYKDAAVKYYSFVTTYFSSTLEIDSLLYYFNSTDRMEKISEERFEQVQSNFKHFQELENHLLDEQEKFAQEFKLNL